MRGRTSLGKMVEEMMMLPTSGEVKVPLHPGLEKISKEKGERVRLYLRQVPVAIDLAEVAKKMGYYTLINETYFTDNGATLKYDTVLIYRNPPVYVNRSVFTIQCVKNIGVSGNKKAVREVMGILENYLDSRRNGASLSY
jgi:hypothetical protein